VIKRIELVAGILMLIIEACTFVAPTIPALTGTVPPTLTALPTSTPTPSMLPTDTRTSTAEPRPSETQIPVPNSTFSEIPATVTAETLPFETPTPTPTPTISCETDTASVILSASAESLKVGDAVKVTVRVNNEGCVPLGLPQYRLYVQTDGPVSIFTPNKLEPVVHYLAVGSGQSDLAEFDLTAVASGQATLTASVSYEVHLAVGAYWGMSSTREPLIIIVAP
jgi:hypothetical protein